MRNEIPNYLSMLRVLAGALFLCAYSNSSALLYAVALVILTIGLLTDFADGYLARKFNAVSETGYILDGLGDRSMYVALILAFVATHSVSLIIAWLLIFREVAIYALRILTPEWYTASKRLRYLSRLHAGFIRLWFLTHLLSDGLMIFAQYDLYNASGFSLLQASLVAGCILTSYYGLTLQARPLIQLRGDRQSPGSA
jgi:phosphatidylglycerophosphate synthase